MKTRKEHNQKIADNAQEANWTINTNRKIYEKKQSFKLQQQNSKPTIT